MRAKDFYNVAVYLRLSKDDGEAGKAESNSITSQRDIIRSFIRKQDNMEIFDFYVDDGWSGANFDRPAFKRMMGDIEFRHIDCVIVKDLSRLGRDYIGSGRLIQKTFPEHEVRFIAINVFIVKFKYRKGGADIFLDHLPINVHYRSSSYES